MSFMTDVLKLYVYLDLFNDIHSTVLLHAKLEMGSALRLNQLQQEQNMMYYQ